MPPRLGRTASEMVNFSNANPPGKGPAQFKRGGNKMKGGKKKSSTMKKSGGGGGGSH